MIPNQYNITDNIWPNKVLAKHSKLEKLKDCQEPNRLKTNNKLPICKIWDSRKQITMGTNHRKPPKLVYLPLSLDEEDKIKPKEYQNDEEDVNCYRFPHSSFCGC